MKLGKTFVLSVAVLSLWGCTQNEEIRGEKLITLTQSEVDLMVERAKAQERARLYKELHKQEQQKQVYDEILIRQGKSPRFSKRYKNESAVDGGVAEKNSVKTIQDDNPRLAVAEGGISKIIPESRNAVLYRHINGVAYYRCAANSLTPVIDKLGIAKYSSKNQELSATLCKKSRDYKTMFALQKRLYEMGYLKSDSLSKEQLVDGVWGEATLVAVKQYQEKHGLLLGQMTIQTLEHIGVFARAENLTSAQTQQIETVKPVNEIEPHKVSNTVKLAEISKATASESIRPEEKLSADNRTGIRKIKPVSRTPVFYQKVGGADYYRCAANSLVPQPVSATQWKYEGGKQELSATLCKKSRDRATMTDLQYELYEKGYMESEGLPVGQLISGQWDERTLQAVKKYQKANGLLYGQLTIETLEHLGVFKPNTVAENDRQTEAITKIVSREVFNKSQSVPNGQIPFEALPVKVANTKFNAATDIPLSATPQLYATVNGYKLWRCRAKSIMPETAENGVIRYNGKKEYRATLCKKNRSKKLITRLQTALRDKGYFKSAVSVQDVDINGIWGRDTLTALKQYQQDHGLAYGQLTIESLEHLGVFIKE